MLDFQAVNANTFPPRDGSNYLGPRGRGTPQARPTLVDVPGQPQTPTHRGVPSQLQPTGAVDTSRYMMARSPWVQALPSGAQSEVSFVEVDPATRTWGAAQTGAPLSNTPITGKVPLVTTRQRAVEPQSSSNETATAMDTLL